MGRKLRLIMCINTRTKFKIWNEKGTHARVIQSKRIKYNNNIIIVQWARSCEFIRLFILISSIYPSSCKGGFVALCTIRNCNCSNWILGFSILSASSKFFSYFSSYSYSLCLLCSPGFIFCFASYKRIRFKLFNLKFKHALCPTTCERERLKMSKWTEPTNQSASQPASQRI